MGNDVIASLTKELLNPDVIFFIFIQFFSHLSILFAHLLDVPNHPHQFHLEHSASTINLCLNHYLDSFKYVTLHILDVLVVSLFEAIELILEDFSVVH